MTLTLDYTDVGELLRTFGRLPLAQRRELRGRIKRGGDLIAGEARQNASWSSRIPGAIKVRARISTRETAALISVDAEKAPHARAYEGISSRATTFRHPVFGTGENRTDWTWVSQEKRPFLMPAVRSKGPAVRDEVRAGIRLVHGYYGL